MNVCCPSKAITRVLFYAPGSVCLKRKRVHPPDCSVNLYDKKKIPSSLVIQTNLKSTRKDYVFANVGHVALIFEQT